MPLAKGLRPPYKVQTLLHASKTCMAGGLGIRTAQSARNVAVVGSCDTKLRLEGAMR